MEKANNKIRIQTENKKENIRIRYTFDDENINLINQIEIIQCIVLTINLSLGGKNIRGDWYM